MAPNELASERDDQARIAVFETDGLRLHVTCRISFDGVENVGRLWFSPHDGSAPAIPDRASIGGRTREEVMELARRLTPQDFELRYNRACAEKRHFQDLRHLTQEILEKIRYMNQVAISAQSGLIDDEGASQEIELTEAQIIDRVVRLKAHVGVSEL
jgi:hypothetical protein